MPETNNSNFLSNEKLQKRPRLKKVMTISTIALILSGSPKKAQAETEERKLNDTELPTTLQNGKEEIIVEIKEEFGDGDEGQDKIKSKEEMAIDYINNNVYVNGKAANGLKNSIIKNIGANLYSLTFGYEDFKEGPRNIEIEFKTNYENNSISIEFQNYKISSSKGMRVCPPNTTLEIDKTTHNKYDIRNVGNGKRENFNIVYNDQKTKEAIEKIVKEKNLLVTTHFEYIDELENTQLKALETPKLGKEVFKDGDLYYRTLFYSTNGKKFDVTNIYFDPNGELNLEKTLENKAPLNILGIDVEYDITAKEDSVAFTITEQSKQELIEKVKQDRAALINMINNTNIIAPDEIFSGLNKSESAQNFQSKTSYLSLNAITGIYHIKLNAENQLEPLHCIPKGNNVTLVAETGKSINEFYANYKIEENNNYKITKNGQGFAVNKIRDEIENPRENLPYYTGDADAINLIRTSGTLTNYNGYLYHYDNNGNLVTKTPCDKQEDESYEYNKDKDYTEIEAIQLYRYPGFEDKVQAIDTLIDNLGITDAEIREIFEKSLKNDGFEFKQKVVEFKNPETGKSIYYKMDKNFNITLANDLYKKVGERLDFMKKRLELAEIINNSHIKRRNGYQYKDFEKFIGGEMGIGKQIISPEQLRKFASGESNEITIRISRGSGQYTDIIYTADKSGGFSSKLKSGEKKGSVSLNGQQYTIETIDKDDLEKICKEHKRKKIDAELDLNCGDIVVDPKEERR